MSKHNLRVSILMLALLLYVSTTAFAQGTVFTYQGKLTDSATPANGQYDFQFKLFDTQTVGTGTQLGTTLTVSNVTVTAGIFTVQLDFGACATCFSGAARFLEIAVKPTSGPTFTTLTSRQPVTSNPYALRSLNAGNATTADGLSVVCVSCVTSSQIGSVNGSAVSGTIPLASVPSGSANYIQNTTSPQSSSNFNISGNGTAGGTVSANVVNAVTQYNIGGNRVLSAGGFSNLFAGVGAGSVNTSSGNSFFGSFAGQANTTGPGNSFFGSSSGSHNTIGSDNSFFGNDAGFFTTSGDGNAFFGVSAGENNSTGNGNAFFGPAAGDNNTTGNTNTAIGNIADVGANNLTNATAIGANSLVSQSNSLVLGSINNVNSADADTKVGIGTSAPGAVLDVQRDGGTIPETVRFTTYGTDNEILGRASGGSRSAPVATTSGRALMLLGGLGHDGTNFVSNPRASINLDSTESWTSTANGTRIRFRTTENGTTSISTRMFINHDGNVGIGTLTPTALLSVNGSANKPGGGSWDSFSDERLKNLKGRFTSGLKAVLQLQPLRYEYKRDNALNLKAEGEHIGFSAQAVQKIIPEAVTRNGKGYLLVNNDPILWTMLNAIKEQQAQIEQEEAQIKMQATALQREEQEIRQQRLVISSLMKLVCADHRRAHICK